MRFVAFFLVVLSFGALRGEEEPLQMVELQTTEGEKRIVTLPKQSIAIAKSGKISVIDAKEIQGIERIGNEWFRMETGEVKLEKIAILDPTLTVNDLDQKKLILFAIKNLQSLHLVKVELQPTFTTAVETVFKEQPQEMLLIAASGTTKSLEKLSDKDRLSFGNSLIPAKKCPTCILSTPFYLDAREVSNAEYKEFVDATGYFSPSHWVDGAIPKGQENRPVVNVSYLDATTYANWVGKRLPTEQEWEAAASTKRLKGLDEEELLTQKNIEEGAAGTENVAEWTSTAFDGRKRDVPKDSTPFKAVRRGFVVESSANIPTVHRAPMHESDANLYTGFRCAKDR